MYRAPQRLAVVVTVGLLVFAVNAAVAAAGGGVSFTPGAADDPPLAQADSLTLHGGAAGDIQAVVYQGNEQALASSVTTTLTGFTAPAAPLAARTTYVVVDGQTNPFNGALDTLSFSGGAGTLSDGPDAFPGGDACPWGGPNCLWDTRTFDVGGDVAPGATSATVSITSGAGSNGYDCINHEAQVFAVGPAAAWSTAGYVAAGAGLRNQASGSVSISGIPAGATVKKALLYWNVLNSADPGGAMLVNGSAAAGQLVAAGPDPCWDGGSWAYRADVTSLVTGNGAYTLSGYPTGTTNGLEPWDNGSATPMMEGASLIVFYESAPDYKVSFSTFIPTNYVTGPPQSFCLVPPQLWPPKISGPQHLVFAGDDRGFDPNATSFRTRQTVGLVPEQSASSSGVSTAPAELVGESKAYAPDALAGDNRVDPADDDAVLHDCHLLDDRGFASTANMHVDVTRVNAHQVKAHLYGGAGNPLVTGAPDIDWDLTLTIDTSAATPHWTLTGAHDGFPAYEVYVNGQTLYTYSPGPGPYGLGDIIKLFPPLDVTVNASGDLH